MSTIKVDAIKDRSDGNTATINGQTPTASNMMGRNLMMNGEMKVAQRGTSVTDVGIDDYSLDRWKQWASSGSEAGRATITQETITDLAGFHKAMKIQVTTADTSLGSTDALAMMQRIEAQDILHLGIGSSNSKTLTLSVYAKAPTGNGTYCMGIAMPGGGHYVEEITVGTSWSRHEINIPATTTSSHATTATGTANGLQGFIALCAGSARNTATNGVWGSGANIIGTTNQTNFYSSTSNNLWLTGWQLEEGGSATDFEHRSFGDELARCQRYFTKFSWNGNYDSIGTGLIKNNGNEARIVVPLPVAMRSNPTASFTGTGLTVYDAANFDTSTTLQSTYSGRQSLMIDVNVSGLTANRPATLHVESSSNAFNLDAEL